MLPKAEYADKPCTVCGIRLGKHYMTMDGSARTAKHYLGGSISDGCAAALREEVARLREQIDYLTDLVEMPGDRQVRVSPLTVFVPPVQQLAGSGQVHTPSGHEGHVCIMEVKGVKYLIVEGERPLGDAA